MKNIHILPTLQPSRLVKQKYDTINRLCLADMATKRAEYKRFNLYITSDEEIKEGDWYFNNTGLAIEKLKHLLPSDGVFCKRIILTTDQDLIKDGVQAIDDVFLEWFVKNPSCEEVIVTNLYGDYNPIEYFYEIIIPKQKQHLIDMMKADEGLGLYEEPKQETTPEEVAEYLGFVKGAKWQQERSYSEEDLKEAFGMNDKDWICFEEWFEQFKKK